MDVRLPIADRPPTKKWGISSELVQLRGGHRNIVFRTVGLAENVVFKSTKRTQASVEWLGEVHDCARQAGFVVPRQIKSLDGELIEDDWTCETFIEGRQIDPADLTKIIPLVLQFHEAALDFEQRPQFESSNALRYLFSGGDVDLTKMPSALVAKCRDAWATVADRPEGIIHGDINSGNVIMTPNDRFALVDWDESRRDLLLFDVGQIEADDAAGRRARLAWEIACSWLLEPDRARALSQHF